MIDWKLRTGWHLKELRLNKLWDTEHTASYTTAPFDAYASQTAKANIVAKQPEEEGWKVSHAAALSEGSPDLLH